MKKKFANRMMFHYNDYYKSELKKTLTLQQRLELSSILNSKIFYMFVGIGIAKMFLK